MTPEAGRIAAHEGNAAYIPMDRLPRNVRRYREIGPHCLRRDLAAGVWSGESSALLRDIRAQAAPLPEAAEVWRGISSEHTEFHRAKAGSMVELGLPTSTSYDMNVAINFGTRLDRDPAEFVEVILKIRVPKGTRGIVMNPYESELLLDRGYALHIHRAERNLPILYNGKWYLTALRVIQAALVPSA